MLGRSYSFTGSPPPPTSCLLHLYRLHTTKWKLVGTFLSVFLRHILAFEVFLLPLVCVSLDAFVMLPSGSAEFPSRDRNHAQGPKTAYTRAALGKCIKVGVQIQSCVASLRHIFAFVALLF